MIFKGYWQCYLNVYNDVVAVSLGNQELKDYVIQVDTLYLGLSYRRN